MSSFNKNYVQFQVHPTPDVPKENGFFSKVMNLWYSPSSNKKDTIQKESPEERSIEWRDLSQEEKSQVAILKVRRKARELLQSKGETETKCFNCKQEFGVFTRRYNCALCLHTFCRSENDKTKCIEKIVPGRLVGLSGKARVCFLCAALLSRPVFQGNNTLNNLLESLKANEEESSDYTPTPFTTGDAEKEELVSLSVTNEPPKIQDTSHNLSASTPLTSTNRPVLSAPPTLTSEYSSLSRSLIQKKTNTPGPLMEAAMWMRSPRRQGLTTGRRTTSRIFRLGSGQQPPILQSGSIRRKKRLKSTDANNNSMDTLPELPSQIPVENNISNTEDTIDDGYISKELNFPLAEDLYLEEFVDMLLTAENVNCEKWKGVILKLCKMVAQNLYPKKTNIRDRADIRNYLKIKIIPGGTVSGCRYISGLVFDKNRTHKKMKSNFQNPRILLLSNSIEYNPLRHTRSPSPDDKPGLSIPTDFPTSNPINPKAAITNVEAHHTSELYANSVGYSTEGVGITASSSAITERSTRDLKGLTNMTNTSNVDGSSRGMTSDTSTLPRFQNVLQITTLEDVNRQEDSYLRRMVSDIERVHPDIIFVEKNVSRLAQECILDQGMCLVVNVKPHIMKIISRICRIPLLPAPPRHPNTDILNTDCEKLYIQTFEIPCPTNSSSQQPSITDVPVKNGYHMVKPTVGQPRYRKTCLFMEGCPKDLFTTLIVRGSTEKSELSSVKKVLQFSCYAAYHLYLEQNFLALHTAKFDWQRPMIPLRPSPSTPISGSPVIKFPRNFQMFRAPASLVLPSLTRRPVVPNLLVTSEISHADIDTAKGNVINPLEIKFDCRAVQNCSKNVKRLDDKEVTTDQLENQQQLVYLHSLCCTSTSSLCILHELHLIDYYSPNDMSLSEFLRRFCFDDTFVCKSIGCGRDMLEHERTFMHYQGRLNVTVKECTDIEELVGISDSICMWDQCMIPGITTKVKFIPLPEDVLKYSFGKYLEMTFYGGRVKCRICNSSLYHKHTRFFYYKKKAAIFQYEHVNILSTALPPLKVPLDKNPLQEIRQKEINTLHVSVVKIYKEIFDRLHVLEEETKNIDLTGKPASIIKSYQDLRKDISTHKQCHDGEHKQWKKKLEEAQNDRDLTDIYPINALQKELYCTTVMWNSALMDTTTRAINLLTELSKLGETSDHHKPRHYDFSIISDTPGSELVDTLSLSPLPLDQIYETFNSEERSSPHSRAPSTTPTGLNQSGKQPSPNTNTPVTPRGGFTTGSNPNPGDSIETPSSGGACNISPRIVLTEAEITPAPTTIPSLDESENSVNEFTDENSNIQVERRLSEKSIGGDKTSRDETPRNDADQSQSNSSESSLVNLPSSEPPIPVPTDTDMNSTTNSPCLTDSGTIYSGTSTPVTPQSYDTDGDPNLSKTTLSQLLPISGNLQNSNSPVRSFDVRTQSLRTSTNTISSGKNNSPVSYTNFTTKQNRSTSTKHSVWAKEPQSMPVIYTGTRSLRPDRRMERSFRATQRPRSRSPSPTSRRNLESIAQLNKFTQVQLMSLITDNDIHILFEPGVNGTIVPVRAHEFSTFIAHALMSKEYNYQLQILKNTENTSESPNTNPSLDLSMGYYGSFVPDTFDDGSSAMYMSQNGSRAHNTSPYHPQIQALLSAPLPKDTFTVPTNTTTTRQNINNNNCNTTSPSSKSKPDDGSGSSIGAQPRRSNISLRFKQENNQDAKPIEFTCDIYYPLDFSRLRSLCEISMADYCQSLARSNLFEAKGGKSGASFSKTLDDRFILKKISKNELDSFLEFAEQYFKHFFCEVYQRQVPTALTKIFGIYSITYRSNNANNTSFANYYILVMENLFYKRTITKIFDLKGSMRNRHSVDQNSILLDEDLLELMYEQPMCVDQKSKADLGMAVWNDSIFLAALNVMDYSLLVGIDEENGEFVVGIIDYLRRYGWDKQLESWVKKTGMLTGQKVPTIISPKQYKKRFRYAIWLYFIMIPRKDLQFVNYLVENGKRT